MLSDWFILNEVRWLAALYGLFDLIVLILFLISSLVYFRFSSPCCCFLHAEHVYVCVCVCVFTSLPYSCIQVTNLSVYFNSTYYCILIIFSIIIELLKEMNEANKYCIFCFGTNNRFESTTVARQQVSANFVCSVAKPRQLLLLLLLLTARRQSNDWKNIRFGGCGKAPQIEQT